MRIAMLHARVRAEERLLVEAFGARGVDVELIDLRRVVFELGEVGAWGSLDLVLDRSLSLRSSLTAVRVLERFGARCVNSSGAIATCSDKLATSLALEAGGVATPRVAVAVGPESALEAVERIGYPAVVKPTVGSWGRLVARVNDRDAAEAVVEHRAVLGSSAQQVFYVQEHVEKPGRDVRAFVVGGRAMAAISRWGEHWITNTARGGRAEAFELDEEARWLCERAASCVGAEIAAVDLLECPRRGLLVNELNHSMEFRNSIETTGVDIAGAIADFAMREGGRGREAGVAPRAGVAS